MPAESTITQYERVVKTLRSRGATDLKDTNKVLALAKTTKNGEAAKPSSISNTLSAVMYHVKDTPEYDIYKAEMVKYMRTNNALRTGVPTEKSVEWKTLSKLYQDFEGQDRVALAVYSLAPPRRLHDYGSMMVVGRKPRNPTGNYLVINKSGMQFIFADYKTKGVYGVQQFKVPPALYDEFVDYAVIGQPLFKTAVGTAFNDPAFSTYIGNLTAPKLNGKRATPNTFRHSFLSWFDATAPTPAKRKEVADFMGHSVGMGLHYVEREEEE